MKSGMIFDLLVVVYAFFEAVCANGNASAPNGTQLQSQIVRKQRFARVHEHPRNQGATPIIILEPR
jgi:hypothetical protein